MATIKNKSLNMFVTTQTPFKTMLAKTFSGYEGSLIFFDSETSSSSPDNLIAALVNKDGKLVRLNTSIINDKNFNSNFITVSNVNGNVCTLDFLKIKTLPNLENNTNLTGANLYVTQKYL
jgi:hypothetical protein